MSDHPVERNAVDLLLDDVAKFLDECPVHERSYSGVWIAVLYLQRAVKAMLEEKRDVHRAVLAAMKKEESLVNVLGKRIEDAIDFISERNLMASDEISQVLAILRGEADA